MKFSFLLNHFHPFIWRHQLTVLLTTVQSKPYSWIFQSCHMLSTFFILIPWLTESSGACLFYHIYEHMYWNIHNLNLLICSLVLTRVSHVPLLPSLSKSVSLQDHIPSTNPK